MNTSCETPEHRESWTSCFLHDHFAWIFFFSFEKISTPEKHLWWDYNLSMGLQMLVVAAQIRTPSRSRGVFQICWAWSLLFWLFCLPLPLRLPPPSSQDWCVQRSGRAALWLKEGHVLHLQSELPVATQPSLSSRQLSIISPAAHHHHLVSSLSLIHQNSSNL